MYRSLLYVPATNERFVERAADRGADAILLDLEDSIPESEKTAARQALERATPAVSRNGADVWVRVNRPMRQCIRDVEAVVAAGCTGVVLPKASSAGHVQAVAEVIEDVERELGSAEDVGLMLMIEDPGAVLDVQAIITAHPRVRGAWGGGEDLATSLDVEPGPDTLRLPKLMVHMAAKAAGIASYGVLGTVADYSDKDAYRVMIAEAKRHGFDGATCIHPSVVPLLNEGFSPHDSEVIYARRVIAALEDAEARGLGAVSLDGKMIDKPVADRARRVLARAQTD